MKFGMKLSPNGGVITVNGQEIKDVMAVQINVGGSPVPHVVLTVKVTDLDVDMPHTAVTQVAGEAAPPAPPAPPNTLTINGTTYEAPATSALTFDGKHVLVDGVPFEEWEKAGRPAPGKAAEEPKKPADTPSPAKPVTAPASRAVRRAEAKKK